MQQIAFWSRGQARVARPTISETAESFSFWRVGAAELHYPARMFTGTYTAIVTPFKGGKVDELALGRLIKSQIRGGVDGVVPVGTTGESPTLSYEEHIAVVDFTVRAVAGKIKVLAGTGANSTEEAIYLTKAAERAGADGSLQVTPYYNKPTQEGLYQHFKAIADSTSLPIVLYNVPPRTNVNILPDTVVRLSDISNIVGVKEASGDISQIADIVNRVPDNFRVLSGDDSMTLPLIAVSGVGLISVASNEAPRNLTALTTACLNNNWDEARRLNRELFPLMKANFIETSPGPVKAALAMMGKIREVYRLPIVPVKQETKERQRAVLVDLRLI